MSNKFEETIKNYIKTSLEDEKIDILLKLRIYGSICYGLIDEPESSKDFKEFDSYREKYEQYFLSKMFNKDKELAEAKNLITDMVKIFEKEPCRKDHHGYCQEHFLQEDCIVDRMKRFIKNSQ